MTEPGSKAWLQRLKDESWEAELLVAAVGIFGTLQLFVFIERVTDLFINILPESFYIFAYFVVFTALLAVSILSSMFIIHFMLRAYWVGLVGLNSVFTDYDIDANPDTKLYIKRLVETLPKLDYSIEQADRLCSVIFAAAFGFLMGYGWLFLASTVYLLIANALSDYVSHLVLLIPLGLVLLLIVAQTLLNILCNTKRYKKHQTLHNIFYRISTISSVISFGPLYKAVLQISLSFSSNFKKDKLLVGMVLLFVGCGFALAAVRLFPTNILYLFVPQLINNPTKADPSYYRNQSIGETFLVAPQLNNNVISRKLIEVFIPVFANENKQYNKHCDELLRLEDPSRDERGYALLACLSKYHQIKINGESVTFDLIKTEHFETKQNGVLAYVKVGDETEDSFSKIEISKTIYSEPRTWAIPFYYLHD